MRIWLRSGGKIMPPTGAGEISKDEAALASGDVNKVPRIRW